MKQYYDLGLVGIHYEKLIFFSNKHYLKEMRQKFKLKKRTAQKIIAELSEYELIEKTEKIRTTQYYKITNKAKFMMYYLTKFKFEKIKKEVSKELATKDEIEYIFKNFRKKKSIIYKYAVRDLEEISKEKIIRFETKHINLLKKCLLSTNPKHQQEKEHLLFTILNVVETLNNNFELDIIDNLYKKFKSILNKICINGISNAKEDQKISCKCQRISIYIFIQLNEETGLDTIFKMLKKIPDDKYKKCNMLQSTLLSELKRFAQKNKNYRVKIRTQLDKLQENPNKNIQERAEFFKDSLRKYLF